MKTAISLPDDLFRALDARARALRVTRSGLLARAARELLERETRKKLSATDAWDHAIATGGQPGEEASAVAFRSRTKQVVRGSRGGGR